MKYTMTKLFLLLFTSILLNVADAQEPLDVLPVPQKVERKDGKLYLDSNFRLSINGNPDSRLYRAATRFLRRLDEQTILWFKQDQITANSTDNNAILNIAVSRPAKIVLKEDESYNLSINNNKITIKATTDLGAMYALETLLQLLKADEKGFYFPNLVINDTPRFAWRGLMIDVVRHFIPYEVIIRNIDAMAAVKMNVLHLHLTDDQGFRIESKVFPKLHEKGSNGKYLTQAQIKDIISYAADRGIRVVPEFDMPGHATSWFPGYPEYASAPGPYKIETKYSHFEPAPTMDPTNENLYPFLEAFIAEMTAIFPDEYIHIGGDENRGKQWDANAKIQEFKKNNNLKTNMELQTWFNGRMQKILAKYGKKMMGWDEILEPGISNDIMIHSWRGKKSLNEAAKGGYPVILSHGFYIDLLQSTEEYYLNDPLSESNALSEKELSNIYGGEAAMWAELATAETIDSRTWPSTAAIAERLWSPREVRDVKEMYRRLDKVSLRLELLGISHNKNYEIMLRRLANGNDITALKTLIDVVEPMKGLSRRKQGITYYTYTPLTMAADAARPDSKTARTFFYLVEDFIKNPTPILADSIKRQYQLWIDNYDKLKNTSAFSPAIRELLPISEDLKKLSEIGIKLVDEQLKSKNKTKQKNKLTTAQVQAFEDFFKSASKPRANVEFVKLIQATEKLLAAANLANTNPPGTVVAYNPASSGKYLGSPSLCILPDGSYLAAHDFFGKNTPENESVIYKSTDKGKTWAAIAKLKQFWSALFVHKGAVYFIGPIQSHNNYVIRKSTDGGYTWTTPTDENTGVIVKGKFHCAPTPIIVHNGRLWRALEDAEGGTEWPKRYGAFLISASVDSDLLKAESWTRTSTAWYNNSYLNGEFKGWLEGNAIVDKNGKMADLIRVHTLSKDKEYAAIIHVKADGNLSFDATKDFINLPGGSKKFTVKYDEQSKRYWTLVNYVPTEYRGKEQMDRIRNTLVLCSSTDLVNWNINKQLLFHPDYKKHGFQYADWTFDGKDIIFLSRTAYDDAEGGAQNFHNTNYITFHRIANFRKYKKDTLKQ